MRKLKISGVWKDPDGNITHYALHTEDITGTTRGVKTVKSDAIRLVNQTAIKAITCTWDYEKAYWKDGEPITVINESYLRSDPDNELTNNLAHLIDYDWLL